jgi:hypothetical protein
MPCRPAGGGKVEKRAALTSQPLRSTFLMMAEVKLLTMGRGDPEDGLELPKEVS